MDGGVVIWFQEFLTSALYGGQRSNSLFDPFSTRETDDMAQWTGVGGGSQSQSGHDDEQKHSSPIRNRAPVIQSVASHCTDWATAAL
jgi:hypothetical protein